MKIPPEEHQRVLRQMKKPKFRIELEVIPHKEQRYETIGDYWFDENGVLQMRVSDLGDPHFNFLVMIHEIIEEHMTRMRGLKEPDIKAFDEMFEKERAHGKHSEEAEPGFDSRAPYIREHTIATGIETMLAGFLGVDWNAYNDAANSLSLPFAKLSVNGVEQTGL